MADFTEQRLTRKEYVAQLKLLTDEELFSHYNRGPFPYDTDSGYSFDHNLAYAEMIRREGKKEKLKAPAVRRPRVADSRHARFTPADVQQVIRRQERMIADWSTVDASTFTTNGSGGSGGRS